MISKDTILQQIEHMLNSAHEIQGIPYVCVPKHIVEMLQNFVKEVKRQEQDAEGGYRLKLSGSMISKVKTVQSVFDWGIVLARDYIIDNNSILTSDTLEELEKARKIAREYDCEII